MKLWDQDYSLFYKFIDNYKSCGYSNINRTDPLILQLEEFTQKNNQYFFIADLLKGNIIFTSKQSKTIVGVEADELNPYHNIEVIHPDELYRNTSGWAKLLTIANGLLVLKEGYSVMSVNMKMRYPSGKYSEMLFQCYSFYNEVPTQTVNVLIVITNIDSFKLKKHGYHYYVGQDKRFFTYPNEKLLQIGNLFTKREFEIIKLIEYGLNTSQIAEKLYLSVYTINTHRCNIIKKSGMANISDVIYDLKERGIL